MRLVPDVAWRTGEREGRLLDPRVIPLLREIRVRSTLRAAVAAVGLSYRSAWDLLGAQARALGTQLVLLERGRGAKLAPAAERLLEADDEARRMLEGAAERLSVKLEQRPIASRLRCQASHDLLLAQFTAAGLDVDLTFRGSLESVAGFAHDEADLAGFHVSDAGGDPFSPYRGFLQPRRDRLIRFASREQGLMLAPGNPKRLRSLADVAHKRARFLNRQRGSGTRLLIDQLLEQAGIAPDHVPGYGEEEFTHVAVAATISAGRADAGVGVRAAATRFGLDFVPLQSERYWLVARERALREPPLKRFVEALRGPVLARLAKRLTGYDVGGAGEIVVVPK